MANTLLAALFALAAICSGEGRTPCAAPPSMPGATRADANPIGVIDYRFTDAGGVVKASAHIAPDGMITIIELGRDRADTGRLDPAKLGALRDKIEKAQLATLKPAYGCDGCTVQFVHVVAVHRGAVAYTLKVVDGADIPDRLMPVIEALSRICGVAVPWD